MNISPAAQKVCDELTPTLRGYAREFGLPESMSQSLRLSWDGESFLAVSDMALDEAEYGNGKGPAPRPVHKALNRLEADAEELLTGLVSQQSFDLVESARF